MPEKKKKTKTEKLLSPEDSFKEIFGNDIEEVVEEPVLNGYNDPPSFDDEIQKAKIETPEVFDDEDKKTIEEELKEPEPEEEKPKEEKSYEEVHVTDEEIENEDYNFDMSIYAEDEDDDNPVELVKKVFDEDLPEVAGYRFRYSHGIFEYERLGNLKLKASNLAIKVAAYKQDINVVKDYYGVLRVIFNVISPVFGNYFYKNMNDKFVPLRKKIFSLSPLEKIPDEIFEELLEIDRTMQRVLQLSGGAFDTDKYMAGTKAEKRITQ